MAREKKNVEVSSDPVDVAVSALEKEFGKGIIISGTTNFPEIKRISSGSIALNKALGGGYPRGRIVEIYGPESAGKTSLALHAIAEAQAAGIRCAFVDAEHALDVTYATLLGVDMDRLLVSQPSSGEQALQVVDTLVRSNAVGLVVVDSVAALTPEKEMEGEMGDSQMGAQARLMSQAMRKLIGPCEKAESTIIFLNQIRMKLGVMFGNPETTSGGGALKYACSQRLDIRKQEAIKDGEEVIGNRTRVKVVKNKVGPPYREAHFSLIYGRGIDKSAELLEIALDQGIVTKAGAWISLDGALIGQGTDKTAENIRRDPELFQKIVSRMNLGVALLPDPVIPELPSSEDVMESEE